MEQKIKQAFTLAEVLITLGIIGVVAAMTIPTLVNNYQKTQYVVQLKKAFSTASTALEQLSADQGTISDLGMTGLFPSSGANQYTAFGDEFVKYFNVAKNCRDTDDAECLIYLKSGSTDGSGSASSYSGSNYYKFVTADGMLMTIYSFADNCTQLRGIVNSPAEKSCGNLMVDVNGHKPPNYRGRDVFLFYIATKNGPAIIPMGSSRDSTNGVTADQWWNVSNSDTCASSNPNGYKCSGRIMEKGWVMDY